MTEVSDVVRVVIVDDDFAVAEVHRAYVEELPGFVVVAVAHSGAQALMAVNELQPDLLLLDIHLPDQSGLEVLQQIRARPDLPDLDILAITAAREVDTVRSAMAGGVTDYLIKPFTFRVFRERLESYRSQRQKLLRMSARNATVRDQHEVDRMLAARLPTGPGSELPKGLSRHTLALVADALRDTHGDLSATEAADVCGLSRVSARRYLEQLVAVGVAEIRPRYGSAGRPQHGYRWVQQAPLLQ